jgi:hypothetical protein
MGFGLIVALTAGCSGIGGAMDGGAARNAKPDDALQQQYAATIRVLPYRDERNMGNPRKIGIGAENLTGFNGLQGTDILLPQDTAVFVSEAMSKRLAGAGYRVVDHDAMYELSGTVKELTYNVRARDEVSISVESTLKEATTGQVVWSGIVVEKKDRFAGVMGNGMDDVIGFLKRELGIVTQKTTDSIGAVLMAQHPELFSILPGTKAIPGVTVLNVAPAASAVPPASQVQPAGAGKGLLVISTDPSRAEVYIDQVYYGLTPLRLDMEPGIHALSVKQRGFKTAAEKVSVRQGETTEVELNLKH